MVKFEVYDKHARGRTLPVTHVRLGKSNLSIPKALMGSGERVKLLYARDKDNIFIGFKIGTDGFLPVAATHNSYSVNIVGFLRKYGLEPAQIKGEYPYRKVQDPELGEIYHVTISFDG